MYTLLYVGFTVSPEGGVIVEVPIAILGETVTLTCLAEGGPGNSYQWQRGGENLENETSENLTLTNVNISDGDDYTCITSNFAGSGNATATLYIMPRIIEGPVDILTQNGSAVNFTCFAVGFPTPAYSWERLNGSTFVVVDMATDSFLEVSPVVFGDEGVYQCVATSTLSNGTELRVESSAILTGRN